MDRVNHLLDYFGRRGPGVQWPVFVMPLLQEMERELGRDRLRNVLRTSGSHMAASHPVTTAGSLDELQAQINTHLETMHWGYCRLGESDTSINIHHYASPLAFLAEVGKNASAAYLESAYQVWLGQAGMPAGLRVISGEHQYPVCQNFRVIASPDRPE